jgi:hypothetical protein
MVHISPCILSALVSEKDVAPREINLSPVKETDVSLLVQESPDHVLSLPDVFAYAYVYLSL